MALPQLFSIVTEYYSVEIEDETHYLPRHAAIPVGGKFILEEVTQLEYNDDGEEVERSFVWDQMMVDVMEIAGEPHYYVLREYYTTCIDGRERVAYSLAYLDESDHFGAPPKRQHAWETVGHSVNREPSEDALAYAIEQSKAKRHKF